MKTQLKLVPEKFDGKTAIMVTDCTTEKRKRDLLKCAIQVKYDYIVHASQTMLVPAKLVWNIDPDTGDESISTFDAMQQMEKNGGPTTKEIYRASFCVREKDLKTILAGIKEKGWFGTEIIKVDKIKTVNK